MNEILAMSAIEAGLFVFVMGLLVVFFGITVIVLVISLIGEGMKRKKDKPAKQEKLEENPVARVTPTDDASDEEEGRIRAAIVAVLTAYYFENGSNCEFKIKKIKRL